MLTSTHTIPNPPLTNLIDHTIVSSENTVNTSAEIFNAPSDNSSGKARLWEAYSSFHDSFTEQLAYEDSRKKHTGLCYESFTYATIN